METIPTYEQVLETAEFLTRKGMANPETAIILGTGLGGLVSRIRTELVLDYRDIPHFPVSTVESHHGKLIYGSLEGHTVLVMQGRFHYYEGYNLAWVTFPVRVMKIMGAKRLLLSNACGALNPSYQKADLMLLDDHINLLPANPLTGPNMQTMGPRFPDMSRPYSKEINDLFLSVATELDIRLQKGVYAAVAGPNLETRAEYRYLARIGADVVGMSTIPECIVANHIGLPCAAVSVITDLCDPDQLEPAVLDDILATAAIAEKSLTELFARVVGSF